MHHRAEVGIVFSVNALRLQSDCGGIGEFEFG